ncbi:hypothetical protein NUW54_g12302 [Trametes sanguinea]|uniref:Uncharacterized protein n=1 Tax=Trametes sanguinea TaxID=158606 RepID=A0ACC1MZ45_9APHY|nr:hypothetical protein NUW54_g12302 [Trametes sanguinea]
MPVPPPIRPFFLRTLRHRREPAVGRPTQAHARDSEKRKRNATGVLGVRTTKVHLPTDRLRDGSVPGPTQLPRWRTYIRTLASM